MGIKVFHGNSRTTIARFFGIVAEWYGPKRTLTIHLYFLLKTVEIRIGLSKFVK
jgi:hypothetical protein